MIDLSIHRCTRMRISGRMPDNANMITLSVFSNDVVSDRDIEIKFCLFDLPTEVTDALERALKPKEVSPLQAVINKKGKANE